MKQPSWAALILSMVFFAFLLRHPGDPTPADTRPPKPREIGGDLLSLEPLNDESRLRGEALLEEVRSRLHSFDRPMCVIHPSLLLQRAESGYRELRLFTLGYPEIAEGWAERVVEKETAPPEWERSAAFAALGILARMHWGGARSVLLRRCQDPLEKGGPRALWILVHLDGARRYRDLCLIRARERQPWAIEALGDLPGDDTRAFLEEVSDGWEHGFLYDEALSARVRLEGMASGAWEEAAQAAIRTGGEHHTPHPFHWAVRIAQERKAPWLAKELRGRATREYQSGAVSSQGSRLLVQSFEFDEVLLALWELGAPVDRLEQSYLREHGYGVDPRVRLSELIP